MSHNTKVQIIEAFEGLLRKKKVESITIKDITDECDLNRKTFYYYFSDVDNLMDEAFDYESEYYFEHVDKSMPFGEILAGFFDMVSENKEIIYHIYNSSRNEHITNYISRTLYAQFTKYLNQVTKGRNITELQSDFVARTFSYITCGFIIDWFDDNMKENASVLIERSFAMTDGVVKLMLDNAEKMNGEEK